MTFAPISGPCPVCHAEHVPLKPADANDSAVYQKIANNFAQDEITTLREQVEKLTEDNTRLSAELAAASVYKPCRRTNTPHVPVVAIGECNEPYWFKGIRETDEEFAERAGKPYQEATE